MDFSPNKTPNEVIKEGAFRGTYLRDIYDVSVNKYGVKCETSLRVWENKSWINEIDPYGCLKSSGILGTD